MDRGLLPPRPPIPHRVAGKFEYLHYLQKLGYFPLAFFPNSGLENFATARRSCCQQNSSSSSTVELVDDTYVYDNRRVVAIYYMLVSCNNHGVFVVQLIVSAAEEILTDIARRAVRLR